MKKIPMRRCVVSGESCPKKDLLRIVRKPDGSIAVDLSGKLNGKGAYLKKDIEILKIAKQKKSLQKALDVDIGEDIFIEIEKIIRG